MASASSHYAATHEAQLDVVPPSYDAAIGSAAHTRSMPSRHPYGDKQSDGYSEKEQQRRVRELVSYPSSSSASASYSSSAARYVYVSTATSASTSYGGMPIDPQIALARFGSPFATSPDWAPSPHDARLTHLPKIDLETRIKMRFTGPSSEERAMAPPPSFSRRFELSQLYTLGNFEPVYISSAGKKEASKQLLSDGFQPVYPGGLLVQRNVSAADWSRFLEDLTAAANLTGKQRIISNVAPVTMHLGATGFLVTRAIERGMKKRKDPLICEAVEMWQQSFFAARNLDVYVLLNGERLTARSPNAPISGSSLTASAQLNRTNTSASSSSSSSSYRSSSDSSVDDRDPRFQPTGDRKLDKKQRKLLKKERKAERKQQKDERKHERKMAKIDKKRDRAMKKYGAPRPSPNHGDGSRSLSFPQTKHASRQQGARGGYLLVIAPLQPTMRKPLTDAAAFMW